MLFARRTGALANWRTGPDVARLFLSLGVWQGMVMASSLAPIQFYFDYISNNAYVAWHALRQLAPRYERRIEPVPVLFAGLLEAHGQLGPAEIPAKAYWMWRNTLRKAALLGLPMQPPAFHPFNPLLALRVSSLPLEEDVRDRLINALFDAVWCRSLHVSEPAVVAGIFDELGLRGKELVPAAQTAEIKALLRQQTDAAIACGVFGVPSMRVGDEVFWGYDDLPYLEMHLSGNDPLPVAGLVMPKAPAASARRRRFRESE